jgi:hypothetical protein
MADPQAQLARLLAADEYGRPLDPEAPGSPVAQGPAVAAALGQTWPARAAQSAWQAVTLPADVYAGRVDPMSDEGIGRAFDMAGLAMTGGVAGTGPGGVAVGAGPIRAYHGSPHDPRLTLPPTNPAEYVDAGAYSEALHRPYVKDGQVIASSRYVPFEGDIPAVGSWRRSQYAGPYGHDIEQLRMVKIRDLDLPEVRGGALDPSKRGDDLRYSEWLNEGRAPPPIEVVEMDKGGLRVSDGHRRTLAAQIAGREEVPAWVSFSVDAPHGRLDASGAPIKTGLTDKIAEAQGASLVDILRKYGVASFAALPPAVQLAIQLSGSPDANPAP